MSLYDENLVDNPFFQEVLRHEDFLNEIIANKLTLCVPCIGSFNKKHQLTLEDVETHTIARDEELEGMFRTYNNRTLAMETKGFKTLDNFDEEKLVKVLFEETFFLDESRYINVICVDSRFDCASLTGYTDIKCDTLQQCTQFLFDENTPWARAQLDDILQKCVVSHKSAGMCLKELVTNTKRSFQRCLDIVEKDFHFSRKVLTNPNFQMFLELSVEFYVMTYLHQTIFAELCYIFGAKDAAVNKTLRNLSQVKPGEIEDLNSVFFTSLPLSQAKMAQLNCEQSPREKVRLLCDCLTCLPNATSTGQAMSMDDLLPLLNYLIIKSEVPNWLANLCYMQHFTFAQYSPDDRHGFTLVCFEASLEHIRNGSLNYLIAPANQGSMEAISLYDTTFSPVQILQNCVLLNRCDDLALILGLASTPVRGTGKPLPNSSSSSSTDVKRCHPLCSCDVCEKSILNLRWKDITVATPFNSSGVSILHIAAQNNYTNMLELLLEQGADVNVVDSAGRSALHLACQRSICASSVLLLISHKANANTGDNFGRTPLHEVCERGHTDILQSMIYQKINLRVNAEAHNGDTPLHLAARYGYGDIVSLLLDVGASMSIRNNKGETPLSSAHSKYISHILQLFSSELELEQIKKRSVTCNLNEEQEKLFRLCAEGDLQMIKHKLNLRAFRTSSMTRPRLQSIKKKCHPLCQCEECFEAVEQSPVSRTLLRNSDHYTLLHIAALYGHADLALLFAGHFNWMLDAVTARHKLSPLHLACQYNNEPIVDILITAGCAVNCRDAQGNTPLHFTCTNGHSGCALLLLDAECDISLGNDRGDTALHCTARWGHIPLTNLLLRYNAPPGIKNKDGLLALHLSQFDEVCEALRRAMGLVSAEQSEDDTSYTDCNSHISSSSPSVERRGEETEPSSSSRGSRGLTEEAGIEGTGKNKNLKLPLALNLGAAPKSTLPDRTPTPDTDPSTTLPAIPSHSTEIGTEPEMNSPISRSLDELTSSRESNKTIGPRDKSQEPRDTSRDKSPEPRDTSRDSPDTSTDKSEVVRELLSECLLDGDDEFGEDWVLQNRPLSFCEG